MRCGGESKIRAEGQQGSRVDGKQIEMGGPAGTARHLVSECQYNFLSGKGFLMMWLVLWAIK